MSVLGQFQELRLLNHQVDHFLRVQQILNSFYFYADFSKQGTGKTFIASAIAIQRNLPTIVICPLSVKHVWEQVFQIYGINSYDLPGTGGIMTYDALRSRKGHQPKHGLLTRIETGNSVIFQPTSLLVDIIQKGVLIIFDEISKLKNNSSQNKAARAIIQQIYIGGVSRIALLSGSPIDQEDQVINFVRMSGLANSNLLYSQTQNNIIDEVLAWARRINPEATKQFLATHLLSRTRKVATKYLFDLFVQIIRPHIMSVMPNPLDQLKDIKNGFYKINPNDTVKYQEGIIDLWDALKPKKMPRLELEEDIVAFLREKGERNLGLVTLSLVKIQNAKTTDLIRVVKKDLDEQLFYQDQPITNKVIIYASYYEVIDRLMNELAEYNPVELTGRIPEKQRVQNIQAFQQPNNNVRVFIGNPLAGGMGISLQDITGYFPRKMYIIPDYRINELLQASDRTTRPGIKHATFVRFFYGIPSIKVVGYTGKQIKITEDILIQALQKKGQVMREMTPEQAESGALFPDQFENEYEI